MDEHELYGAPREQFIAERTAWAKTLRADGRRDEATRVAALRKPSVAAWTVNQLVRAESDRITQLCEAGDELRAAQDRMLSGGGTSDQLREAVERERAAVDALMSLAAGWGMSDAVSDRVAATLHAAALDEHARRQVSRGQLVEELQHVGFGGELLAAGPAPRWPKRGPSNQAAPRQPAPARRGRKDAAAPAAAEAMQAEERARAEEQRLAAERKHARRAERDARRRLESAERALAHAEEHHARARAAFKDAEDTLRAAQAEAETASAAHDEAQRALDAL
jgi:hypothetical protein